MSASDEEQIFEAPGKLMLAGEYSVLSPGGLAVALAVNPPALRVLVTPADRWELARSDLNTPWREGLPVPDELCFVHAGWSACQARFAGRISPRRLEIQRVGDAGTGSQKPGVGGSAGATAVTVAAMFGLAGHDPSAHKQAIRDLGLQVHRGLQGGRGSGYDVATIVHGALVSWSPEQNRAESTPWPADLHLLAGYSGKSASTPAFLARVAALKNENPEQYKKDMIDLARPVHAMADAVAAGDTGGILTAVEPCHRTLLRWDRRHGLGIVTDELTQLIETANGRGAAAKVSGAGGGDSAVALCRDPEQRDTVKQAWLKAGFTALDATPTQTGIRRIR